MEIYVHKEKEEHRYVWDSVPRKGDLVEIEDNKGLRWIGEVAFVKWQSGKRGGEVHLFFAAFTSAE